MTTPTLSAYPRAVEELMPAARALASKLGKIPSRNHLMREFKVGSPKATALREALAVAEFAPTSGPVATPVDTAAAPTADLLPVPPPAEPESSLAPAEPAGVPESSELVAVDGHPDTTLVTTGAPAVRKPMRSWVLLLLAAPAFVAIWSGWVGLGGLTGFGVVHPLPGIWDSLSLNTAITLPIGVEAYAAYALRAWLSGDGVPRRARRFAAWSAIGSLLLGAAGQVAYHLMESAGITSAPWQITTLVACLPVVVLGMGAALAHLLHTDES